MAYLHCHSCNWSQDDFWDFSFYKTKKGIRWSYNPFSVFIDYIERNIKPRRIKFQDSVKEDYGWKRTDPHSWFLIYYEFKRMIRKFKHQKWWTYEDWKKDKATAVCPNCGDRNFDID